MTEGKNYVMMPESPMASRPCFAHSRYFVSRMPDWFNELMVGKTQMGCPQLPICSSFITKLLEPEPLHKVQPASLSYCSPGMPSTVSPSSDLPHCNKGPGSMTQLGTFFFPQSSNLFWIWIISNSTNKTEEQQYFVWILSSVHSVI